MSQGAAASSESLCGKDGGSVSILHFEQKAIQKHLNISKLDSIKNAGD